MNSSSHRRRYLALAAACALVSGYAHQAQGQTFNVSWVGPVSSVYATASNWSTNVMPNNNVPASDFFNVTINRVGGATVTMNADPTLLNLTIGANPGNALLMGDARQLTLIGANGGGPIALSNAGTLSLGGTAAATANLLLNGTSANISGGGTITMFGNSVLSGAGTVTSSNTIIGQGNLGNDTIAFINNGIVQASGGTLTLDARASGGFDNNNVLEALPGGTMVFSGNGGGSFTNTGGSINANGTGNATRARVNLMNGATIVGGTLNSNTFGLFFVPGGHAATLSGVTNNAEVNVSTSGTLNLIGTIQNNNSIHVNASAGVATFDTGSGTVTLNGSGSLSLGNLTGRAHMIGTGTLVNNSTIVNQGLVGDGAMVIRNNGLISSGTGVGTFAIEPTTVGTGVFNAGTINCNTVMVLVGGTYANTGTISATAGELTLSGVTINGGTLLTSGAGVIRTPAGSVDNLNNVFVENQNTFGPSSNGAMNIATSVFHNTGTFEIAANSADLTVNVSAGTLGLTGVGQVLMTTVGAGVPRLQGAGTLNNVSNTIHGLGFIGNNTLAIINAGTISADVFGSSLNIDPGIGGLTNSGTLEARAGANLVLIGAGGGAFINTGTIQAVSPGPSAVVALQGGAVINGGTLQSDISSFFSVTGGAGGATVNALANRGSLRVQGNAALNVGTSLFNSGTVDVQSTGTAAQLMLTGGTVNVNGSGTILLRTSGLGSSVFAGTGTLNNVNNLIRGSGLLGNNAIAMVNAGTILADVPAPTGAHVMIDPSLGGLTNSGTLLAQNSGLLILSGNGGGGVNNASGTLQADNGTIGLRDAIVIDGGTFTSIGTGNFQSSAATSATVNGITLTAGSKLWQGTNTVLTLGGTVVNNGTIGHLPGAVIGSTLQIPTGTTTLNGSGLLQIGDASGVPSTVAGPGTLVIAPTQSVAGHGTFGSNTVAIRNAGTINANASFKTLRVDPGVAAWTNTGTMLATNGGILELNGTGGGSQLGNTGGRIIANDASTVRFNSVILNGGILGTAGSGTVALAAASTSTFGFMTSTGNVVVESGRTLTLEGPVTNSGTITIDPGASSQANMMMLGSSILHNNGTILLNDTDTSLAEWRAAGGAVLNNNGLIRGDGSIDVDFTSDATLTINNSGAIESDGGGLGIGSFQNPPLIVAINNTGVLRTRPATNNANFGLNVQINGTGTLDIQNSSTLASLAAINTPTVALNGGMLSAANLASLGRVAGTGSLIVGTSFIFAPLPGDVTVKHVRGLNAVAVQIGTLTTSAGGGTLGTSFIEGTLTIGGVGAAQWNLTDHDLILDYAGASALPTIESHIASARNSGAWNGSGLTSTSARDAAAHNTTLGAIEASSYIAASGTTTFSGQTVDSTSVLVKYTYYGDTDFNGVVDFDDYSRADAGFNNNRTGWFNGDFDYNGVVDFDDYSLIDQAFNTQSGALRRALSYLDGTDRSDAGMDTPALRMVQDHFAQFGNAYATAFLNNVPEPSSVAVIIGLGAVVASKRRRRRCAR